MGALNPERLRSLKERTADMPEPRFLYGKSFYFIFKVIFFGDPSQDMSSNSFLPKKQRPLNDRPDRSAKQRPGFYGGNLLVL